MDTHPPSSSQAEFYGFTAWVSTSFAFFIYLLWAFLPDDIIQASGVTWYPNREWAILVPAWSIILALLTYFSYFALAFYNTPPFHHISTITDTRGIILTPGDPAHSYSDFANPDAVPEMVDLPLSLVNKVLFS